MTTRDNIDRGLSDDALAFINNFVHSSRRAAHRKNTWSDPQRPGHLLAMKFHEDWRHNECPVMGWYSNLLNNRVDTRIRFIQHHRSIEAPCHHEFLVLYFADGSVCRVEREGDGMNANALRYAGCPARDLIQWFSGPEYPYFACDYPSWLLVQVDMCCEFDLLDVLGVCYSIQKTKLCNSYTLQWYNCYFLCLTVLAVLTRRKASWETAIPPQGWDWVVSSGLGVLWELPREVANNHFILKICSLLDPYNNWPLHPLINVLGANLRFQPGVHTSLTNALGQALWARSSGQVVTSGLAEAISSSADAMFADRGNCGAGLQRAHGMSWLDVYYEFESYRELAPACIEELGERGKEQFRTLVETYSKLCRMKHLEQPISFWEAVSSKLFGHMGAVEFLSDQSLSFKDHVVHLIEYLKDPQQAIVNAGLTADGSLFKMLTKIAGFVALSFHKDDGSYEQLLLEAMEVSQETALVPFLMQAIWHAESKGLLEGRTFVAAAAKPFLDQALRSDPVPVNIRVKFPGSNDMNWSAVQFQEGYLLPRIRAHAQNVWQRQLAASDDQVYEPIESTMSKVWSSMPPFLPPAYQPSIPAVMPMQHHTSYSAAWPTPMPAEHAYTDVRPSNLGIMQMPTPYPYTSSR
ncbi:hypothetical protein FRC10_004974 [Ceratobasidium sp. 414]|nr:hypothetical protein FRC10_004974 [Ceratobasidium sp. 414]